MEKMTQPLTSAQLRELREYDIEENGKHLGTCARCGGGARDKFGFRVFLPSGYTHPLASKKGAASFCSTECAEKQGFDLGFPRKELTRLPN